VCLSLSDSIVTRFALVRHSLFPPRQAPVLKIVANVAKTMAFRMIKKENTTNENITLLKNNIDTKICTDSSENNKKYIDFQFVFMNYVKNLYLMD